MKKINYLKITLLFLLTLCVFSILTINLRNVHFDIKEKEMIDNVLENIKVAKENKEEEKIIFQDGSIGMICIPSIEVKAPIYEGTSKNVLKYSVGHFTNTSLWFRKYSTCFA